MELIKVRLRGPDNTIGFDDRICFYSQIKNHYKCSTVGNNLHTLKQIDRQIVTIAFIQHPREITAFKNALLWINSINYDVVAFDMIVIDHKMDLIKNMGDLSVWDFDTLSEYLSL